jgi:hypothetical protein
MKRPKLVGKVARHGGSTPAIAAGVRSPVARVVSKAHVEVPEKPNNQMSDKWGFDQLIY